MCIRDRKKTLLSANRFVFQKALREEELAGMGTTAVCALAVSYTQDVYKRQVHIEGDHMNTIVTSKEDILKNSRELIREKGWAAVLSLIHI